MYMGMRMRIKPFRRSLSYPTGSLLTAGLQYHDPCVSISVDNNITLLTPHIYGVIACSTKYGLSCVALVLAWASINLGFMMVHWYCALLSMSFSCYDVGQYTG